MSPHPLDDVTPLTWAPLTPKDLPDFAALVTAIEHLDDAIDRQTLEEMTEYFHSSGSEPEISSLLGRDRGGNPAAWAWNRKYGRDGKPVRIWLRGSVHPVWRSQNIGRRLFDWQIQQAREWYARDFRPGDGPLQLIAYADEKLPGHKHLLLNAGMTPARWYIDMVRPHLADIETVEAPEGVRLVPLTPARYESVRLAHNQAFESEWGADPVAPHAWEQTLNRAAARPQWSWVAVNAECEEEVVGYAICSEFDAEEGRCGWIDHLGVRREWRHRGVASAVVTACMRTFADQGLPGAGLGVDVANPDTLGLYERLGYEAADTMVLYKRDEESADGRSLEMGHHQA
ncbi:GNAT family N-acetyltransferase [Enemella sp. A6]|uniref:GNAT family N-acetyltransferase n=1 Tax=Enemella sp. A6 TaxID=3440152 RepID=UPI003EC10100